ncbi:GH15656 [Drosophila grimshawi]|uniref:GH15656 n=1 Tax=Drosophila grimshawi TaxID=7222 RepID=B4IZT0_DROGR|nr:GH15656 [Drosophila grimshawi]
MDLFKLLLLLCSHCVLSATVRPYKFGFTIEEQQHRQEKRDENGIVMGEFGFITADGIYHVTVYATDENGKFHIVSMKNYPYAGPIAKSQPAAAVATTTQRTKAPPASQRPSFNTAACSGCFLHQNPPEPPVAPSSSVAGGGNRSPKTEIRPLSLSLPIAPSGLGKLVNAGSGNRLTVIPNTQAQPLTHSQIFDNVAALQIASIDLANRPVNQGTPATASPSTLPGAPATPATPATTTTPAPEESEIVKNAKAVALAIEIAKVNSQLPTRPTVAPPTTPPTPTTFNPNFAATNLEQQTRRPPTFSAPNRPLTLEAAQRINGNVVTTMQAVTFPVAQAVASVVNRLPQDNALTPTPPRRNRITAASPIAQQGPPPFVKPKQQPGFSSSPSFKPSVGSAGQQPGFNSSPSFKPSAVTATNKQQPQGPQQSTDSSSLAGFKPKSNTPTKTGAAAGLTGDLYKFKYLLDYNGHEETGARNGDKQGNYFAISDDAIAHTVEYIANEFGFQPHITWRKLEGNEATLPDENTLKHYEFKWFNQE